MTVQQVLLFASPSTLAGLAVLGWTVHLVGKHRTASVRDGLCLQLTMPPAWALELARAQFAVAHWRPAAGDGAINRQHLLPQRPGLSVEAVVVPGGGSEVHIWMSSWTLRWGIVRYAAVARRQMHALADVLAAADRSYPAPAGPCRPAQDILAMLLDRGTGHDSERESGRNSERGPRAA